MYIHVVVCMQTLCFLSVQVIFGFFFFFWDSVLPLVWFPLCRSESPDTCGNPPVSASQILGPQMHTTTPSFVALWHDNRTEQQSPVSHYITLTCLNPSSRILQIRPLWELQSRVVMRCYATQSPWLVLLPRMLLRNHLCPQLHYLVAVGIWKVHLCLISVGFDLSRRDRLWG